MPRIRIALAGDILPTRRLTPLPPSAAAVFQVFADVDFALGNFEMPLVDDGVPIEKLLTIRANPKIAQDLPVLGFDLLTLANNHAVDCGWRGLKQTADRLREQQIAVIGLGENLSEASASFYCEKRGLRLGVLAFSCLTPAGMSAADDRPGISPLHVRTGYEIDPLYQAEEPGDPSVVRIRTALVPADQERALTAIKLAKAGCDVLIVTVHWGFGSGETLAEYQVPASRKFIEAGADIIHGHHPHAIHAIGHYQNKPIIFSAGTLIGQQVYLPASEQVQQMWREMSPDGFVSVVECDGAGAASLHLVPTTLDANRMPRRAVGADFTRIAERLERLSAAHGTTIFRTEDGLGASATKTL